ncbi:MAG: hypothetical protein PWR10_2231 [Halanaerobiales bacterium]|nr:hypothetical protein [Halanaerobiales bacterium]
MKYFKIIFIVSIKIIIALVLIFPHQPYLKIENTDSSKVYYYRFPKGSTFSIRYLHSYDRTPVLEVFKADKCLNIIPVEVKYYSDTYDLRFARYSKADTEVTNEYVRIYNIIPQRYDRLKEVFINIKNFEPQYLSINPYLKDYSFINFGEKGDLLRISIVKNNFIQIFLRGVFIND